MIKKFEEQMNLVFFFFLEIKNKNKIIVKIDFYLKIVM